MPHSIIAEWKAVSAAAMGEASRRLSCGVLVFNPQRELLLCHVTHQDHWDLPKGGLDAGESTLQAALRETREETGLRLDPQALVDLGQFHYRPKKSLYLYATLLPRIDLASLSCESHFREHGSTAQWPEMDGYAWVAFTDIARHCTPRMTALLTGRLDLPRIVDGLMRSGASEDAAGDVQKL